jgi:glycine cleavage system H lipoate-binding protein
MRCPFYRETRVRYCGAVSVMRPVIEASSPSNKERCSSPGWPDCSLVLERARDFPRLDACPYLRESPVQYCAAASVTKYLPQAAAPMSPCGDDSHRYCEFFLNAAHSEPRPAARVLEPDAREVGGIRVPRRLAFSPNHMWVDVGEAGSCHIGVDDFFARLLGRVERVTCLFTKGICNPTVVFDLGGMDLQMAFPNPLRISRINTRLHVRPERLIAEPYTAGWLFEGTAPEGRALEEVREGLIQGEECTKWMARELRRLEAFLSGCASGGLGRGGVPGTEPAGLQGLITRLKREDAMGLINEFFVLHARRVH